MSYLQQLHEERKARLNRFNAAAQEHVSRTEENNKPVQEISFEAAQQLIQEQRAKIDILEAEVRRLLGFFPQRPMTQTKVQPDEPTQVYPTVFAIKELVARTYGVSIIDLESHCREAKVTRPRQIAIHLARRLTTLSFPAIGRKFGERDHSTCLHAHHRIEECRKANVEFDAELAELERKLTAG